MKPDLELGEAIPANLQIAGLSGRLIRLRDEIVFQGLDGAHHPVTAAEIYALAVLAQPIQRLILVGSPRVTSGLNFAFATARLRLACYLGSDGITCQFEVSTEPPVWSSASGAAGVPDQAVMDDVWYAVDGGDHEALEACVNLAEVAVPGTITAEAYARLLQSADTRTPLVFAGDSAAAARADPSAISDTFKLYPYQLNGLARLQTAYRLGAGCVLADGMGLGKTAQAGALMAWSNQQNSAPSLVVAPLSLLDNWRRELRRIAPQLRTLVHHGATKQMLPRQLRDHDVVITSWDTVVSDLGLLQTVVWNAIILDEAQVAKNSATLRHRSAAALRAHAVFPLTGTPVENRLSDLTSMLHLASARLFPRPELLAEQWDGAPSGLRELARPFLLRRTADIVGVELPDLVHIQEGLIPTRHELAIYRAILNSGGHGGSLGLLTKLRQATVHPALVDGSPLADPIGSAKMQRLVDVLVEIAATREKAIVASPWHALTHLVNRAVTEYVGVPVSVIDGTTPQPDRQRILDEFAAEGGAAVLVLAPKAAGVGLNIQAANHVIFLVPEWNPATIDQLTARAHRIGQERPVFERLLFYPGTIDEAVLNLLDRKRLLAAQAIPVAEDEESDMRLLIKAATTLASDP